MIISHSIYTKHLEIEYEIRSVSVNTHSVMSSDKELRDIISQGVNFTRDLIRNYEKVNKEKLEKVGK